MIRCQASTVDTSWNSDLVRADLSRAIGELVGDIGGSRSTLWREGLDMSPKQYLLLRRFEEG